MWGHQHVGRVQPTEVDQLCLRRVLPSEKVLEDRSETCLLLGRPFLLFSFLLRPCCSVTSLDCPEPFLAVLCLLPHRLQNHSNSN